MAQSLGPITMLTAIAPLKKGVVEKLRAVLQSLQTDANNPITQISTIHFARWVIIDEGTRLLFSSIFDGPFDGYLEDFAKITPDGLDQIFGACEGYPAAGARDFAAFKDFVQTHRVDHRDADVFSYAAYSHSVNYIRMLADFKNKFDKFLPGFVAATREAEGFLTKIQ